MCLYKVRKVILFCSNGIGRSLHFGPHPGKAVTYGGCFCLSARWLRLPSANTTTKHRAANRRSQSRCTIWMRCSEHEGKGEGLEGGGRWREGSRLNFAESQRGWGE
jgi:hypothetical protein